MVARSASLRSAEVGAAAFGTGFGTGFGTAVTVAATANFLTVAVIEVGIFTPFTGPDAEAKEAIRDRALALGTAWRRRLTAASALFFRVPGEVDSLLGGEALFFTGAGAVKREAATLGVVRRNPTLGFGIGEEAEGAC
jgi:hypothetical protein